MGLPILEAQACGCPVIASKGTSCEEVASKNALIVKPENIDDIKKGIDAGLIREARLTE